MISLRGRLEHPVINVEGICTNAVCRNVLFGKTFATERIGRTQ